MTLAFNAAPLNAIAFDAAISTAPIVAFAAPYYMAIVVLTTGDTADSVNAVEVLGTGSSDALNAVEVL